jgi:hypothetical protein
VKSNPSFAIPIALFRNCGYALPVSFADLSGAPYFTPGWDFRLEITPTSFDGSWTEPASFSQQNTASGSGDAGTTFILYEEDTAALDYKTPYSWRVLALAPGADPSPIVGGPCKVYDGPVMTEVPTP